MRIIWLSSVVMELGSWIIDHLGYKHLVISGGVSNLCEPQWATYTGEITFDGSVLWQDVGKVSPDVLVYTRPCSNCGHFLECHKPDINTCLYGGCLCTGYAPIVEQKIEEPIYTDFLFEEREI